MLLPAEDIEGKRLSLHILVSDVTIDFRGHRLRDCGTATELSEDNFMPKKM